MKSDIISNINPENNDWDDKVYITFDIDWAHDEVLSSTIDLVEYYDVCATWFVTHQTPALQRLKKNPKFELGIHPNFNFLLSGDNKVGINSEMIIDQSLELVADAVSVRSHSMTQNSFLLQLFKDKGLTHDCNHFIPYQADVELKPWKLWNGLIKCPYFWEDDIDCLYDDLTIEKTFDCRGIKIYDFHPIHIFLNTEKIDRYQNSRSLHQKPDELKNFINDKYGVKDQLIKLLRIIS